MLTRRGCSGTYIDKKCPFTSDVSIRGRILTGAPPPPPSLCCAHACPAADTPAAAGTVRSAKMRRTIIIRRDYLHYIKKYQRYEKRHKNVPVHLSPAFRVKEGDKVIVGQCRPLSKTVRFNVLKVIPMGSKLGQGKQGKSFAAF